MLGEGQGQPWWISSAKRRKPSITFSVSRRCRRRWASFWVRGWAGSRRRWWTRWRFRIGQIPHFPQSTVAGHSGSWCWERSAGVTVAVMQGRVHAYEGYTMEQVTFPMRVLGLLGCRKLIVTNAAGGIRADIPQGSLVAISDHINLTGTNAAMGPNEPRFACVEGAGQRFFDMSTAYSPELRKLAAARGGAAEHSAERRRVSGGAGTKLRDAGGDSRVSHAGRGPGGHVDGA